MTWVWENSPYDGAKLLIHLALADWADDKGNCWPNQTKIASKARCTDRYVRQTIQNMVSDGILLVTHQGGGGPGDSNRYQLTRRNTVPPLDEKGGTEEQIRGNSKTDKGELQPLYNRQEPSVLEPSRGDHALTLVSPPSKPTLNQIADQITKAFYDSQDGAVNFNAVRGVVTKMLKAGHDPESVAIALAQAEDAGKPLTSDVLRQILKGRTGGRVKSVREKQAEAGLADYFQRRQSQ